MRLRPTLFAASLAAVAALAAGASTTTAVAGQKPAPPSQERTLQALADRHRLVMGTAIDVAALDDPQYREIASTDFGSVTAENVMKWEALEPVRGQYDWSQADAFMAFAKANKQRVRGHVLVWNNQLPAWLTQGVADGTISKTELRELLRKHVKTVASRYRGQIWQWDVVNEAATDPWDSVDGKIGYKGFWAQNLGPGYVADAFRWAREADPKALLFYNDYNIDAFGDGGPLDKTQFVHDMVRDLRRAGVPVDGVGSQAHLSTRYGNFSPYQLADMHHRFAELGVATALTEVDVRNLLPENQTSDTLNPLLQAQAYNYAALMQGCLSSRKCISYTVWLLAWGRR